jgi:hypothetical protein
MSGAEDADGGHATIITRQLAEELAVTSALLQETLARLNWLESTVAQAFGMSSGCEPLSNEEEFEEKVVLESPPQPA